MSDKKLKFSSVLKLIQESDEYIVDGLLDEIDWTIENTKKDFYEHDENGDVNMNVEGGVYLINYLGLDENKYRPTLAYLNKTEGRKPNISLDTNLHIRVDNISEQDITQEEAKKYIETICTNVSTNGKDINELDTTKLRERDINTINRSVKRYEDMAKAGHKSNAKKLKAVYDYVNDNDPDICRRMLYYYDYDPIEFGDFIDRYNYMDYKQIKKAFKKFKKYNKKR